MSAPAIVAQGLLSMSDRLTAGQTVASAVPSPTRTPACDSEPPGRLPNGLWKCIACGRIVGKRTRWLNWCSDCGYDEWEDAPGWW